MKSILKRNRVLAVIALIGLLASLVPLISRVQAEESNKYYDIVLDYNSMRSMARQSSQSEDEWLDLFKSLGVDKVALSEASALNLLTIPALVFIYYFRTTEKVTFKGIVYATLIAGAILILPK